MYRSSDVHDAPPLAEGGLLASARIRRNSAQALPFGAITFSSRASQAVPASKLPDGIAKRRRIADWLSSAAAGSALGTVFAPPPCLPRQGLPQRARQGRHAAPEHPGRPTASSIDRISSVQTGAAAHGGPSNHFSSLPAIVTAIVARLARGAAVIQEPRCRMSARPGTRQYGPHISGVRANGSAHPTSWRRPAIRRSHVMVAAVLIQFCGATLGAAQRLGLAEGEDAIRLQAQAGAAPRASAQTTARQAIPARAVTNLLGVQPDLNQGNWASIEGTGGMIEQARFVGAGILRVSVPDPDNWATPNLPQLVAAGLKLDFIAAPYAPPDRNALWIKDFLTQFPGSVALVEGPNEPNNFAVEYAGETGVSAAMRWQADFYAAMKADPVTAHVPIYGLASFPKVAAASDVNNLHVYPIRARQARRAIEDEAREQRAVDPGKPWGITEFGYFTIPGFEPPGQHWEGVDEVTQAKLLASAYFDAASLGASHLILFNLRDWCSNRADDVNAHFGLFRCDNSPKPAANILRNIAAHLADHGEAVRPGRLSFRTNASPQVRDMLLQRGDGRFVLVFWRTPDIWDENADRQINHEYQRFTLQFEARQASVQVFDPLTDAEAVWSERNAQQVPVVIVDRPVIVVVSPR